MKDQSSPTALSGERCSGPSSSLTDNTATFSVFQQYFTKSLKYHKSLKHYYCSVAQGIVDGCSPFHVPCVLKVMFREVRSLEFLLPHTQSSLFFVHLAESYCQFYLSSAISKKLQNLASTLKQFAALKPARRALSWLTGWLRRLLRGDTFSSLSHLIETFSS